MATPCTTRASSNVQTPWAVANIAIALAEINHSVLVIDADMRRPRLHGVFDVKNKHGLSDLLLEKKTIDSMTMRTMLPAAAPLVDGKAPPPPPEKSLADTSTDGKPATADTAPAVKEEKRSRKAKAAE